MATQPLARVSRLSWLARPVPLAVNALAAYRLTRLWTRDTLPPLPRVRERITAWAESRWLPGLMRAEVDNYPGPDGERETPEAEALLDTHRLYHGKPPLVNLVDCPWCVGFWISAAVVAAATLAPRAWTPLATALAMSAVVGQIAQSDDRGTT